MCFPFRNISSRRYALVWTYATWALLAAALMVYAETLAFTGDEGFHMLAAQLIKAGKRPYLDFCFPQTPLNAYWNAFWMRVFGESWRTAHAVASLLTSGAVILAAQFILSRFPERAWAATAAMATAAIVGLNSVVVEFGPLGQAYGMCLFTIVAAFRLTVSAVERRSGARALAAGVLAGVAAGASLLAAPVAPVLLIWLVWNSGGGRWVKAVAFLTGCAAPFLPVLALFARAPWVVWFNIAEYHLYYRAIYWPDPLPHDLETLTGWTADPQAVVLGLLAIGGVVFIWRRSNWDRARRSEFYLCGWLVLGIAAELAFGHPTFARYFCLTVPFLAILAAAGLYAIGSRVFAPERTFWPAAIAIFIMAATGVRAVYDHAQEVYSWPQYEDVARKIEQVAPTNRNLFTVPMLYFLTKRRPPAGMEFEYSHKLNLPAAQMAALHAMPEAELKRLVAAGTFYAAATCDAGTVETYGIEDVYRNKTEVHECPVFWEPKH
jgi:hypothetical protein